MNTVVRRYTRVWGGILLAMMLVALFAFASLLGPQEGSTVLAQGNSAPELKASCDETLQQDRDSADSEKHYLPLVSLCPAAEPTPIPSPTPDPWTAPEAAIEVFSPVKDAIYHSPIEIIGYSQTFEGSAVVRLRDDKGKEIARRHTMGGSVDGYDFFHTRLRYFIDIAPGKVMSGTVEVFEISANDGSEINKVTIPVLLQQGQRRIDVDSPRPGEAVCQPASISGYSNTFEASVVTVLSGRNGDEVVTQAVEGGNLGFYREFSGHFEHEVTEPRPMLVEAYEGDARGWGNIDHTRIPISLYPCPEE